MIVLLKLFTQSYLQVCRGRQSARCRALLVVMAMLSSTRMDW
jgi:hypothetical protein